MLSGNAAGQSTKRKYFRCIREAIVSESGGEGKPIWTNKSPQCTSATFIVGCPLRPTIKADGTTTFGHSIGMQTS